MFAPSSSSPWVMPASLQTDSVVRSLGKDQAGCCCSGTENQIKWGSLWVCIRRPPSYFQLWLLRQDPRVCCLNRMWRVAVWWYWDKTYATLGETWSEKRSSNCSQECRDREHYVRLAASVEMPCGKAHFREIRFPRCAPMRFEGTISSGVGVTDDRDRNQPEYHCYF